MEEKLAKFICKILAKLIVILLQVACVVLVTYAVYTIYVLGSLPGSFTDKLKALPPTMSDRIKAVAGFWGIGTGQVRLPAGPVRFKGYVVLVGTYNNSDEAERIVRSLKQKRISPSVSSAGGKPIVIVGPFTSQAQANVALRSVRASGFPGAQLILPSG